MQQFHNHFCQGLDVLKNDTYILLVAMIDVSSTVYVYLSVTDMH